MIEVTFYKTDRTESFYPKGTEAMWVVAPGWGPYNVGDIGPTGYIDINSVMRWCFERGVHFAQEQMKRSMPNVDTNWGKKHDQAA